MFKRLMKKALIFAVILGLLLSPLCANRAYAEPGFLNTLYKTVLYHQKSKVKESQARTRAQIEKEREVQKIRENIAKQNQKMEEQKKLQEQKEKENQLKQAQKEKERIQKERDKLVRDKENREIKEFIDKNKKNLKLEDFKDVSKIIDVIVLGEEFEHGEMKKTELIGKVKSRLNNGKITSEDRKLIKDTLKKRALKNQVYDEDYTMKLKLTVPGVINPIVAPSPVPVLAY